MNHPLSRIAESLGARLEGRGDLVVTGAAEPASAGPDQLAIAMTPRYAEGLARGKARAAVLWEGADWQALGLQAALFVPRPRFAMAGLTRMLDTGPDIDPGIHPSAVIEPGAELGVDAAIGPLAVIGRGARIGPRARIGAGCVVGANVQIGADVLLMAGVRIGRDVQIGDRFIAQPGAVIGGDGFSFVTPERSSAEVARETLGGAPVGQTGQAAGTPPGSHWVRIHSLGAVSIGNDVEIGANTCIDRGTIRDTRIGHGSKIHNLVQIGHNVEIGQDCLICGQTGVAGSARIGNRVVLGGGTAVNDNITIGDDVVTGGRSGIASNVPAGRVMFGTPATRMDQQIALYKAQRRLPRLIDQVAALQDELRALTDRMNDTVPGAMAKGKGPDDTGA
ncbi:MAG: UDP-3-O-(3-hydroxymyristoyl)glucosamine N-acyltransferase [Pararhodobacter sp.]|nr:UDP-3-O-(3-hydroxymyristoyl)glucosamine N-acyltransferase [Pararhodobacter sp.]